MASAYTLEFEKPLLELERQIEDLKRIGTERQIDIDGELEGLQAKLESLRAEIYRNLTPIQRVMVARHPRRPYTLDYLSTIFTAAIIGLAAALTPIGVLSQLVSIGTLLAFVLVCIGVIILRKRAPDAPRPFRTPAVPLVPIAGAAICLAQMVGLPAATWERLVIWLCVGLVVYFSYGRRFALAGRIFRPQPEI